MSSIIHANTPKKHSKTHATVHNSLKLPQSGKSVTSRLCLLLNLTFFPTRDIGFDAFPPSMLPLPLRSFGLSPYLAVSLSPKNLNLEECTRRWKKARSGTKKHKRKWLRKLKSIKTTTAPASVKTKRTQVEDGTKKAKKGLPKREKEWESERERGGEHICSIYR